MSDAPTPSVPVGTLAKLFNLTEVRVQQLVKLGVVVRGERGRYDLWPSIQGYIKYLQERTGGRSGGDGSDYEKHRTRLYKARADAAELSAQLMNGKMHEAEKVAAVWTEMISAARSKLLALPTRAAGKVMGLSEIAQVKAVLEENVNEALNELSDYEPGRVASDAMPEHLPEMEAADEADGEPMG